MGLLCGAVGVAWIHVSVTRPLRGCLAAAVRLARGETRLVLEPSGSVEVSSLAESLERSAAALEGTAASVVVALSEAASSGPLHARAEAGQSVGRFTEARRALNGTLDSVSSPLLEVRSALERLADSDLRRASLESSPANTARRPTASIGRPAPSTRRSAWLPRPRGARAVR